MAGNRVQYIIDLVVQDKQLRQQMAQIDWEKIVGSKGKGISDAFTKGTADAAKQIKNTFHGLDINWSQILGTKDLNRLEQQMAKVLSGSKNQIKAFAAMDDTTGIQRTVEYVSALGDELKDLGSSFDAAQLARGMSSFMKVLTPLSDKIDALAKEPAKVEAAFDRLFGNIVKSTQSVDIGKTFDVSGKIKIAMQGLKATNEELVEASENLEKYKRVVAKLSGSNPATIKLAQDLDGLNKQLDEQMQKEEQLAAQGKTNNAQYAAALKNIMAIENARLKLKAKPSQNYAGELISQDFDYYEEKINKVIERASQKIEELEGKLANTVDKSFAEVISKQISDIKLSVSLSDNEKSKLVNEINAFVQDINKTPFEKVKIGISQALDDSANLIKDEQKRKYGQNEADDDVNTTKLIAQTEKRFKGIRGAMHKNQNKILNATKEWRNEMLKQFKFNSGDFEFKFNDTLIEELQTLFDDYALKINIDPQHLADQIKTVLNNSGGSLGSGTANIDVGSMASAIAMGLEAALTGVMPQAVVNNGGSGVNEDMPQQVNHIATEIDQSTKHLDLAEDYVKDVVTKLRAVAQYATKHIGTDKDSAGAQSTRETFNLLGGAVKDENGNLKPILDLVAINQAKDDTVVVKMIEQAFLQRDEFGNLKGSTIIDRLSKFKGSSSKAIPAFLDSMTEVFFMLQENTQTVEEWTRKRHDKEIFDVARGTARAASGLREVRAPIRQGEIPNIQTIDNAISLMSSIGQNTDDLQILKSAREALGDKTDGTSIQEFKTAADTFYKSSTKIFWDLKKQAEDTFKGTVYFQGKNGKSYGKNIDNYKQLANIKDDAVITDVQVASTLSNVALGVTKSKYSNRISQAEEQRLIRNAVRPDYIVPRQYEKDILNKELTYQGFKSQSVASVPIDFDATIEGRKKTIVESENTIVKLQENLTVLEQKIQTKQAEVAALSKTLGLIGAEPTYKMHVTDDYGKKFDTLYSLREHAKVTNEANLPKEGYSTEISNALTKKTTLSDRLSKLTEQARLIEKLTIEQAQARLQSISERLVPNEEMALYQKFISNPISKDVLRKSKDIKGYSTEEVQKLRQLSVDEINARFKSGQAQRESMDLYSRFIQNPDSVRNAIETSMQQVTQESIANQKNLDSYIVSWAKSEEAKIPEAEAILRQAAEKVLSKIGSTMNSLYKDMMATEEKLKGNISNEERTVLTAHMQDLFKMFAQAQDEYNNLVRQNNITRKKPLGTDRLKNITSLQSQYSGSVRNELSGVMTSTTAEIAELNAQKLRLRQQELEATSQREHSESLIQRAGAEKEYNKLLEKSLMLQGSIEKMAADGAEEKALQKKQGELDKVNVKLAEAKAKVDALGGFLGAGNTKEYSDSDRKTYALNELQKIEDDLITARAQKRVSESRISQKDREIADLDKWGLGAGIGASELGRAKGRLTSEFMSGDYVQSQVDALREKTKAVITEAENKSREIFDKKVAVAMEHLNWNPLDQTQVQKFLNTKHGQQLSNDFASEVDTNTTNIWKQYDTFKKDLLTRLKTEFQESFQTDKGVLTATSKVQDETGQWIDQIVEVRVKEALRARLEEEKNILESKHAPIQGNIDRLEADKAVAIEYGGISDKELLSGEIIEDQIRKEERLEKLKEKRAEIQQKLNDLENAGIDHSDDTYKSTKKDLNSFDKEIARYDMLIKNRQKLVQMRYDESKEPTYTDEERELHFTNQIVSYNEKIENSLAKQKNLKEQIVSATGDDKTKLERQLSIEEANVAKWRDKIPTFENKLNRLQTSKSQGTIGAVLPEGGIVGGIVSAVSEVIGSLGAGVEINTEDLAKETTLNAILEVLGGTPQGDDGYGLGRGRKATDLDNVWKEIPTYKNATTDIDTLRSKAVELKSTLDTLYDEGKTDTVDFLKAQTELSRVLTLLRNKVSKDNPNVYGEKGNKESAKKAQEYWKSYLTSGDSKLFDNLNNVSLSSMNKAKFNSALKKINGTGNNLLDETSKTTEPVPVKVVADKSEKKTRKTQASKKAEVETNDDAQQSSTRQATGGLIQIVSRLATEDTLIQVLNALHTLGTTEGGITAPTAAGDLYNQFKALLLGGSIDDHERLAYMNSETGAISGNIIGNIANISDKLIKALRAKYPTAEGFDTQVHTHGKSSKPYFSTEDYKHFAKDYESGIKKQVLLTKDHISVLDLSAVKSAEEVKALMDELIKAGNNAKAVKKVFEGNKSGAIYESAKFDSLNADSLVKMLGTNVGSSGVTSEIDALLSKLQDARSKMKEAVDIGYLSDKDVDVAEFDTILNKITAISEGIKNGTKSYEAQKIELDELVGSATRYNDIISKTIAKNKRSYAGVSAVDSVNNQRNKIVGMFGEEDDFNSSDIAIVQQYNKAVQDLNGTYQTLANNRQLQNENEQQALSQQAFKVQALGKHLISSMNQAQQLKQYVDQTGTYIDSKGNIKPLGGSLDDLSVNQVKNLESTMRNYVQNTLKQANIENVKFNSTKQQLIYTFRTGSDTVADMVVQYNAATNALYAYNTQERESLTGMKAFVQSFKSKLKSITQYMFSITSITRIWGELKQGVQYIREIDTALTELKKVTDETEESYDRFLKTAAKTADKVGSTIKEIVSSTADWARIGYSLQDATMLAESTSILLNVSEFQSIDDATSALTSTLQAFGYTANQSMGVVDVLNEVGNNFAISSDGIATALQDSASSLMAANNSYEQAVALIAAANRVVQDPNSVGAALRTISLRLRGTSVKELEEAGEDTVGAIESTSKLRSKVKSLSGVDILTDTGAYKDTYTILLEISKVWKEMSDIDQAALLELIAGKTRSNTAAALLSNTKDLEKAYEAAMNAEGSALAENEKYLDSIQGRIDLFNNSIQTMWNTEIDSGIVKFFVDLGTSLVKIVDQFGLINTLVFGLMSYLTIFKKNKYDLASMLGIHSIEGGWLNNKKKKKLSTTVEPTIFQPTDGEQIDVFSDEYQTQLLINEKKDQIKAIKAEIKSLDRMDWNDIKIPDDALEYTNNKARRKYVREVLIPSKEAEITAIQKDIDDITNAAKVKLDQSKTSLVEGFDGQMMFDFDGATADASKVTSKYLDIFEGGLAKGATEKLTYNTKQLGIELDKLNGMDNAGVVAYMQNLDNLGDIGEDTRLTLAAYASTVEDGNYTLQGAQKYVKNYNQNLAKLSKEATIAQFKQNMLNLAISALTMLLSALITKLINSAVSAQDEFEKLSSQLSSTKSELDSINSELDDTKSKIEELQNQGSLSFVEQEELDRLKAQNEELERQKDLKEAIHTQQQKDVNSATVDAANDYYKKTGVNSGKTTGEIAGQGVQYGVMAGGAIAAAGATALAGALGSSVALFAVPVIGPIIAGLLIAGTVAAVGAGAGAIVGGLEEKVGESMDNMRVQYSKLQEEYNAAQNKYATKASDGNYKKMQKAQEKLIEYESMMANHLAEMDSYYSQIDLSVYDPVEDAEEIKRLRNEMNEFYDTQDKWLIQSGSKDAKVNAITRIFGENASQELKNIKREIQDTVRSEDWDGNLNLSDYFNPADLEAFTDRLHDMGIYAYEVENYFKDMAEAEKEAAEVSLYGVVTDISKLTDGLENLKSAFDETLESGSVTAKTLTELNEVFGALGDSWDNYVNTMFSGVASTKEMKEATEALAKAFIDSKILTGEAITEFERMTYIIQLRNMGVTNAEEYVDDKIAENAYKAMQNSATYDEDELESNFGQLTKDEKKDLGIDGKDFDELSTDELEKIAEYYNMSKEINAETAQKIADEYGVEIENLEEVINLLEEKARAEKKAADAKKAQAEYDEWLNDGYKQTKEQMDALGVWERSTKVTRVGKGKKTTRTYTNQETGEKLSESEFEKLLAKYDLTISEYNELIDKFNQLVEEGKEKGWINDDGTLKEGVEEEFASAYKAAQDGVSKIEDQISSELTAEIKLELKLQDENKAIDDIQSVFDSLKNAQKEYAESGYLSVDTMQELLGLSPKYLNLLYDEHGQLNLNEEALYRVAEARITDMGIAQQNAIVEQALELATTDSRDALLEYTDATYKAVEGTESLVETQLKLLKTTLQNRTQDQTEQQERTVRGRDGTTRTETVTVVTKVADLSEEEAGQIYDNTVKAVNATGAAMQSALAGVRKGGLSSSGGSDGESALETLQKKYERKISNLDNQQTYLENEIEALEAKGEGISKQYYEQQIDIEKKKLNLYEQQRKELSSLLNSTAKGSDQWWEIAESLWSVEHAIQESTLRMIEFRKSIIELYQTAFDDIADAYGNKDTLFDDRKAYIEGYAELLELQNELVPVQAYKDLMALEEQDKANNIAMLESLQAQYNRFINSAEYKEGSKDALQAAIDMQAEMRATEKAIQDNDIALAQFNQDLKDLYVKGWDKVMEAFSNKDSFFENQQNFADAYISRLEALNINVPDSAYDKMIEIQKMRQQNTEAQLEFARQELSTLEQELGTDGPTYFEKYSEIVELEQQLYEGETQILEWQQQIIENQFERFDKVVDRINDSINELQNIADLVSKEDVATEDGEWTDEGLVQLGLTYQQMETSKKMIEEYGAEIDELTRLYNEGEISEQTYYERLQELKDGQWDSIKAYKDAEDAIVDLNEARIDMIEEGINEEIEAYQELIDLKKEELDAERDLFDFRKDIQKQTKDIAALERRIASMSGSTDAATIAERTKLQAELREAREGLDDTYYGHAMDSQANALDDEMESYEEGRMDYLESLRESIKETDKVIEETYEHVLSNGDTVLKKITELSNEYGFKVSENLTTPWVKGSISTQEFATTAYTYVDYVKQTVYNATSPLTESLAAPWNMTAAEGGPVYTFSAYVSQKLNENLGTVQGQYDEMKNSLSQPWLDSQYAVNTFSDNVVTQMNKVIAKAEEAARAIENTNNAPIVTPNYSTDQNPGKTGGGGGGGGGDTITGSHVEALQKILHRVFGYDLGTTGPNKDGIDGSYGPKTKEAVKKMQKEIRNYLGSRGFRDLPSVTGNYDAKTKQTLETYLNNNTSAMLKAHRQGIVPKFLPAAMYAKGTLGTTRDQWAYTNEPWLGDELTMYATPQGTLSFMRAGSTVVPADLTQELMDIANIGVDGLTMPKFDSGVNMVSNAINKPEIKLDIENFLRCDNVSQDSMPELKKFVNDQMNSLVKQLNYGLKKFK